MEAIFRNEWLQIFSYSRRHSLSLYVHVCLFAISFVFVCYREKMLNNTDFYIYKRMVTLQMLYSLILSFMFNNFHVFANYMTKSVQKSVLKIASTFHASLLFSLVVRTHARESNSFAFLCFQAEEF